MNKPNALTNEEQAHLKAIMKRAGLKSLLSGVIGVVYDELTYMQKIGMPVTIRMFSEVARLLELAIREITL